MLCICSPQLLGLLRTAPWAPATYSCTMLSVWGVGWGWEMSLDLGVDTPRGPEGCLPRAMVCLTVTHSHAVFPPLGRRWARRSGQRRSQRQKGMILPRLPTELPSPGGSQDNFWCLVVLENDFLKYYYILVMLYIVLMIPQRLFLIKSI